MRRRLHKLGTDPIDMLDGWMNMTFSGSVRAI